MKDGLGYWVFASLTQKFSSLIIPWVGMALDEAGERQAFYLTSDTFRPGSWRTGSDNEIVPDNDAMKYYQEGAWAKKIWDHTSVVWDKALEQGSMVSNLDQRTESTSFTEDTKALNLIVNRQSSTSYSTYLRRAVTRGRGPVTWLNFNAG
jgi:hypothetical protein